MRFMCTSVGIRLFRDAVRLERLARLNMLHGGCRRRVGVEGPVSAIIRHQIATKTRVVILRDQQRCGGACIPFVYFPLSLFLLLFDLQ